MRKNIKGFKLKKKKKNNLMRASIIEIIDLIIQQFDLQGQVDKND